MIKFRQMNPEDIPAGLALCRSAGWNQISRDWELFLLRSPDGCRVAVDETNKVIGTVTTIRYENHFSWIGMVLVDPEKKRQGIGTQLLQESLRILQDEQCIKLDATPAGREVYLKLNFTDEYSLTRMQANELSAEKLPASRARLITQKDLTSLLKADREIFGADRKEVLEWILKGAPQFAWLVENSNTISGYGFGREGHHFIHIGPVIAGNIEAARQVVSAALQNCNGKRVILDVMNDSTDWLHWLSSIGFQEQRQLIRMYRGTNSWPGIREKQFAILGPEFG